MGFIDVLLLDHNCVWSPMCFVLFVQEIVHIPGVWTILFRRHLAVHGECHVTTDGLWSRFVQLVEVQGAAEEPTAVLSGKDEVDVIGRLGSSGQMPSHWLAENLKTSW